MFFPTVQSLQRSDPYEGALLRSEVEFWANHPYANMLPFDPLIEYENLVMRVNRATVVSCWHINEFESAAMWRIFAPSLEGIAVQSTVGRLCKSFKRLSMPSFETGICTPLKLYVGKVDYRDFTSSDRKSPDIHDFVMRKPKYYEYEHELRLIIDLIHLLGTDYERPMELSEFERNLSERGGLRVGVDIYTLIEQIVVMSPPNQDWFCDLVKSLIDKVLPARKKSIFHERIRRSSVFTYQV